MDDNEWRKKEREKIFDEVCTNVLSLFQSKRAHLKKQVTHWYGKFMIVKAENNQLRKKIRKLKVDLNQLDVELTVEKEVHWHP